MSKTYRDARNAACAVQSAADQIVHALTEAALDQAETGKVNRLNLLVRLKPLRHQLESKVLEMYEIIGEQHS